MPSIRFGSSFFDAKLEGEMPAEKMLVAVGLLLEYDKGLGCFDPDNKDF